MYVECKRNVGAMFVWRDYEYGDVGNVGVKENASFSTELKLAYDIEAKGLVGGVALVTSFWVNEKR